MFIFSHSKKNQHNTVKFKNKIKLKKKEKQTYKKKKRVIQENTTRQVSTSGISKDRDRHNTVGSLYQWPVGRAWWDYLSLKSFWRKIQQSLWALQILVASDKVCTVWSFCGYVCRYVKWWIYSLMLPSTEVIAECWKLAKCPSIGHYLNNWCCLCSWNPI